MGYRSEVAIEILSKDKDTFEGKIGEFNHDWDEQMTIASEETCHEVYIWHEVKWYDSFKSVIEVMAAMRSLDQFAYIRIGEDDEDLEFENCLEHDVFIGTLRRLTVYHPDTHSSTIHANHFDKQFFEW